MEHRDRLTLALAGCLAALALLAAQASARVEISTRPGLHPAFRRSAPDYVSRCERDRPLRIAVRASGGDRVAVADRPARGGEFVVTRSLATGEALAIRVHSSDGGSRSYHVRCLPRDFPHWSFHRHGTPQARWYVTTPVKPPRGGYVAIFDAHGAPVWWRAAGSASFMPWDAKLVARGLLAWAHNYGNTFGVRKHGDYEEHRLDGELVHRIRTRGSPTDVHDVRPLPNGHFLGITYRRRDHVDLSAYGGSSDARVFDGEVQELSASGAVVWRWNSRGQVSPAETGREWWYDGRGEHQAPATRGYDLLHVNSVEPDGDGVIVSARHLDAVLRIDRRSGKIDWKLGGTYVPGESLTVLGAPPSRPVLRGQHDARLAADGTLTVYDNRTYADDPPAAERFRIDAQARTARRIERVVEPDVRRSQWGGSARRLPGGNWVVCWGGTNLVTEQAPSGRVVLALRFRDGHLSYRAVPVAPGALGARALRRGMDAMAGTARRL